MYRSGPYVPETVELEISTKASSGGLIFWHGPTPTEIDPDDFFSIAVNREGKVELQWDYGSGVAKAVSNSIVNDGEKHLVCYNQTHLNTCSTACKINKYDLSSGCSEKARSRWDDPGGWRGHSVVCYQ